MKIKLTQDKTIPMVGFGTYLVNDEEAQSLVHQAISLGYRHLDTAEKYDNETGVGLGIKAALGELGISRDEIFITTKLWPGNEDWGQAPKTYASTIESLEISLAKLELDYVDLYLIHAPFPKAQRLEQWKALIELRRLGKAKAIGVSNFNETHIEEIRAAGLPLPDANQIELHPWSQKQGLVSYLAENGITAIAYSSLVPLPNWRDVEGQPSAKTEEMKANGANEDSPFETMAKKYGVSQAQVLLRWGLQKGYAVLPKSKSAERMRENINLFSFEIDAQDMAEIADMDMGDGVAWDSGDPSRVE